MQPGFVLGKVEVASTPGHEVMDTLIGHPSDGAGRALRLIGHLEVDPALAVLSSMSLTIHGACRPRAVVNRVSIERFKALSVSSQWLGLETIPVRSGSQIPLETV
jgi:hypothetical protein